MAKSIDEIRQSYGIGREASGSSDNETKSSSSSVKSISDIRKSYGLDQSTHQAVSSNDTGIDYSTRNTAYKNGVDGEHSNLVSNILGWGKDALVGGAAQNVAGKFGIVKWAADTYDKIAPESVKNYASDYDPLAIDAMIPEEDKAKAYEQGPDALEYLKNTAQDAQQNIINREAFGGGNIDKWASKAAPQLVNNAVDVLTSYGIGTAALSQKLVGKVGKVAANATVGQRVANLVKTKAAKAVGMIPFGTSVFGNAYTTATDAGYDYGASTGYAAYETWKEIQGELLFDTVGIMSKLNKAPTDAFTNKLNNALYKLVNNNLAGKLLVSGARLFRGGLEEGAEELFGDAVDMIAPVIFGQEMADDLIGDADFFDDFMVGFFSGIMGDVTFDGAGKAVNGVNNFIDARAEENSQIKTLRNYTPEQLEKAVNGIVEYGLNTSPDTKTYRIATQIKDRMNSGETPTIQEIGRLAAKNSLQGAREVNAQAILQQIAAEKTGLADYEDYKAVTGNKEAMSAIGVDISGKMKNSERRTAVDEAFKSYFGMDGKPLASQNKASGETKQTNTQIKNEAPNIANNSALRNEAYSYVQSASVAEASQEIKGSYGRELVRSMYDSSVPAHQYLSDYMKVYNAALEGKEATGLTGVLNEERISYIKEAAKFDNQVAKEKENELRLQKSKERNADKSSGKRTAQEEAGNGRREAADEGTGNVSVEGKATRDNLSLNNLSEDSTAEIVKYDDNATEQMRLAMQFAKSKGVSESDVYFLKGKIRTVDENGNIVTSRGLCTPDGKIYVQIDDHSEGANKIIKHEYFHRIFAENGWNAREVIDSLKKIDGINTDVLDSMVKKYVDAYMDNYSDVSEYEILEEFLADSYAGINQFNLIDAKPQAVLYKPVSSSIQKAIDTRAGPDTMSEMAQATYTPVKHSISLAEQINEKSVEKAKKQFEAGKIAFTYNLVQSVGKDIADLINGKKGKTGYSLKDLQHMTDKNGMQLLPDETSFTNNIFSNSSYLKDAEPTTECYRQAVYKALANRVSDILGRPLSNEAAMIVNQAAIEIGIDAPCIYCYSLLDRKSKEAYKLQYVAERDAFMQYFDSEYKGDKAKFIADMKQNFDRYYQLYLSRDIDPSGGTKRSDNQKKIAEGKETDKAKRVKLWMDMYAYLYNEKTGVLSLNNIRNAVAEEETKGKFSSIKDANIRSIKERELKDLQYWVQASSQAKKIIPYSSYSNLGKTAIINWKKAQIDALNGEYGLRWYSHADYHPAFVIDNIQQITDAAIMGLKGLMYVKPVDAAKVFAPTGMNINVSCFAQYVNGEYVMDDRMGANWDEVKALRDQYGNVGAVMVATSDDMVLWALSQDWVDVVIPLHLVRSGAEFVDAFGLNNYSAEQADKITNKDKYEAYIAALAQEQNLSEKETNKAKKSNKSIYPVEHQNDYDRYMGIVNERGITPRFNRIREAVESGIDFRGTKITPAMYMKLVNETRQSESQTNKLQPVFDFNAAWESVQSLTEKGYYDYFKESSEFEGKEMSWEDWAQRAASDIEEGKKPNDLGYGRELAVNEEGRWIIPKNSAQAKKSGVGGIHSNARVKMSRDLAPTFFLKSEQLVNEIKSEKIGASSVIPYLKGKGVKDEEIKWTGIQQFLEGKKSVSKAELSEFIKNNDFQYDIDTRGFQGDAEKVKQLRKEAREAKAAQKKLLEESSKYQYEAAKYWFEKKFPDWDGSHLDKLETEPNKSTNPFGFVINQFDRLASYWLREGNDYSAFYEWRDESIERQHLVEAQQKYFDLLMAERNAKEEAGYESKRDNSKWSKYKLTGGSNYRELIVGRPGSTYSNQAMNVHWERNGVLAHARIQDMKTTDKQNMLFIEEIQSDWHNQGHKSGYTDVDVESLKKERTKAERAIFDRTREWGRDNDLTVHLAARRIAEFYEDNGRYYNPNVIIDDIENDPIRFFSREAVQMESIEPGSLERVVGKETLDDFLAWKDEYETLENSAKEIRKKQNDIRSQAPDAPFRQTYSDFVMKLLLRQAAENGYDSIGWTASEQQLDRWNKERATNADLRKQGYGVTFAEGAENEVAFKKGYEKEYDQDIPGFMKKYVKQWGSAVTVSELKNGEKVWSVPITESMRNDVLYKGQSKYSLALVPKITPTADHSWNPSLTTEEVMKVYPDLWNVAADEAEDRNPTQITSTVSTYRKIYDILKAEGFNGKILDASSGRGFGTQAGIYEYGFDVDDIEPFADSAYALGSPKYTDYSTLDEKYDAIISNAVLNVLPGEQRDALVVKMGDMLNPGGRMFINVRSLAEIQNLQKAIDKKTGKIKNVKLSDSEVAETTHGSYQKGFTSTELKEYLEDALGSGFKVEKTSKFGGTSVIVTKDKYRFSRQLVAPSYDDLIKKDPIKIVDIGSNEDGLSYKDLKTRALDNARKRGVFDHPHHNDDTDLDIFISEKSYTHAFSNLTSSFGEDTILAMNHIEDIVKESVFVFAEDPKNVAKDESKVYTFFGAVRCSDGIEPVKLTVKEFETRDSHVPKEIAEWFEKNGYSDYNERLYDAKVLEVIDVSQYNKNGSDASDQAGIIKILEEVTSNPTIKISNLLDLVNGYARKYIPNNGNKLSRAITEVEYNKLNRKYDAAVKLAEYWRKETKTSTPHIRESDIRKFTSKILKDYSSTLKIDDVIEDMTAAINRFTLSPISDRDAVEMAYPIAKRIIESSEELVNDAEYKQYKEIRKWLKNREMIITAAQAKDIPDFSEWKKNNRFLNIKFGEVGNIDRTYQDLRAAFPDLQYTLFPEVDTGAGDQLKQIVEGLSNLNAVYDNPFSREMAEAIQFLAEYIFDGSVDAYVDQMIKEAPQTFADKKNAEIQALREKIESERKAAAEDKRQAVKDAKLAGQIAQGRKDVKTISYQKALIDNIRISRDRQIREMKDMIIRQRLRKVESKQRQRLLKIAKRLTNAKLPKVSRDLLNQYIGDLDLVAVSITGQKIQRLMDLKEWYENKLETDPDFIKDSRIENNFKRLERKHIKDMSIEDVVALTEILLNIESEIRNERKLINSQIEHDTYVAGAQVINDIRNSAGTGVDNIWDKYVVTKTLTPEREIHRNIGYVNNDPLYVVTKELSDGQREMYRYQIAAEGLFKRWLDDKEFLKGFTGKDAKLIEVTGHDKNGKLVKVQITPAMRASLYLHYKAEQNLRHIATGGVEIPNAEGWVQYRKGNLTEAFNRSNKVAFTKTQVEAIIGKISAKEKAFADAAHEYFNGMSKENINRVSEDLKGYSLANVEDYFPITSDRSFLSEDFSQMSQDGVVENLGFTNQRTPGAVNPIMLFDLNTVLVRSIAQHAKYVGLAIPVRNFTKLWNVKPGYNVESLKGEMKKKWTGRAEQYIDQMMKDVQGMSVKNRSDYDNLVSKIRGNYAAGVLTLNAGVAFKQGASFFNAATVLGWDSTLSALPEFINCVFDFALHGATVNTNDIRKYTPLWDYRMRGFANQELGEITSSGKHLPAALNWIQYMDGATTRALWKAAENKVAKTYTGNRNSADFKADVAKVYNQVIEETQPNYTMMQRPAILRDSNDLIKTLNMFKSQPFQNFNVLYDAIGEYNAAKKAVVNSRSKETIKALAESRTKVGNACTGFIVSSVVFVMMQYAWDVIRGRGSNYSDGDDEPLEGEDLLAWIRKISANMASTAFGIIPFMSYAVEAGQMMIDKIAKGAGGSPLFGGRYYGMEVGPVSAINDAATSLAKVLQNATSILTGNSKSTAESLKSLVTGMADVADFFGIPASNVKQLFEMPFKWFDLDISDFID